MSPRVELRNHPRELQRFQLRLAISAGFVLLLFLILFARFFYLQVSQREHYHTLAEANRISIAPIVPNRGLIFDRNGEVLAHNYSAYTLEIVPSKVKNLEDLINELSTVVEIAARDRKRFKRARDSKAFPSVPVSRTWKWRVLPRIAIAFRASKSRRAYSASTPRAKWRHT